jgi:quercetin dioxygenase-like cupin family protein
MEPDTPHPSDRPEPSVGRNDSVVLGAEGGRSYDCGSMVARFLADGEETADTYSVSEWTLAPGCRGVGAHRHESNDDVFYVVAGTVTFQVDGVDHLVGPGGFVRAAPGVEHDFRNDGDQAAVMLNLYVPGGFEADMPGIVDWFATHHDEA